IKHAIQFGSECGVIVDAHRTGEKKPIAPRGLLLDVEADGFLRRVLLSACGHGRRGNRAYAEASEVLTVGVRPVIGVGQELNAERRVRDETARQLTRYRTFVVDREILIERPSLRDEALSIHQIEAGSGAEWIEARRLGREVGLRRGAGQVEHDAQASADT